MDEQNGLFRESKKDWFKKKVNLKTFEWTGKLSFLWTHKFYKRFGKNTFLEQDCFILNIQFFHTDFCKNYCFFINQTILFNKDLTMNKQFYWTIVQWENERNRWKWPLNSRTNEINFFLKDWKKQTKWVV